MALRKIAHAGHPVLRQPTRELSRQELLSQAVQQLIDDLIETLRDANGAGLAANQIFEPVRLCAVEVNNNPRYPYKPNIPLTILVNPRLTFLSEETFVNFEGCLSVPNMRGQVRRRCEVRVEAWDRHGGPLSFVARGLTAGTYQHEVDHLDGKLFIDNLINPQATCTWENFERFHKEHFAKQAAEIVARWGG